jgi:glutamate---cysteine ligase / carboxylate-amine ligase
VQLTSVMPPGFDEGKMGPSAGPAWAHWNDGASAPYTLGIEEELLLLSPADWSLAQCSDLVLERLPPSLVPHVAPETHAAVVELVSGVHPDVGGAIAEMSGLRRHVAFELASMGLCAAGVGMYPLARSGRILTSHSARYRRLTDSLRELAHREPTLALHVHVGLPDPEDAVRVLNALRDAIPVLLALSVNSPYSQSRDSGFASLRSVTFQGFPRTGSPRRFASYADYVAAVDPLIVCGAVPDPSFLWWDVRLQPKLGTVETRVMDAQASIAASGALAALIHSLARAAVEEQAETSPTPSEALAENRFLAARDGTHARLVDPRRRMLTPVRDLIEELLERCRPHAVALGCAKELAAVRRLIAMNGAALQRRWTRQHGLQSLVGTLAEAFTQSEQSDPIRKEPACVAGSPTSAPPY